MPCVARRFSRVTRNPKLEVRGTVSQLRLFVGLAGVIAGAVCARARDGQTSPKTVSPSTMGVCKSGTRIDCPTEQTDV